MSTVSLSHHCLNEHIWMLVMFSQFVRCLSRAKKEKEKPPLQIHININTFILVCTYEYEYSIMYNNMPNVCITETSHLICSRQMRARTCLVYYMDYVHHANIQQCACERLCSYDWMRHKRYLSFTPMPYTYLLICTVQYIVYALICTWHWHWQLSTRLFY